MRIDPERAVRAFMELQPQGPAVQEAVTTSALKQTMETAEQTVLNLLASLEPHKGQHLDVRA
jgi:hypothetical protein